MNSHLGTMLKAARRRSRLSQQHVADLAGIGKSYLWKLEKGQSAPSLLIAARLSTVLDVSVGSMAAYLLKEAKP